MDPDSVVIMNTNGKKHKYVLRTGVTQKVAAMSPRSAQSLSVIPGNSMESFGMSHQISAADPNVGRRHINV